MFNAKSKSAYLFTYCNILKLVSFFIIKFVIQRDNLVKNVDVLTFLAERSLPFHGHDKIIGPPTNWNYLERFLSFINMSNHQGCRGYGNSHENSHRSSHTHGNPATLPTIREKSWRRIFSTFLRTKELISQIVEVMSIV